jgi:hypothetical protein
MGWEYPTPAKKIGTKVSRGGADFGSKNHFSLKKGGQTSAGPKGSGIGSSKFIITDKGQRGLVYQYLNLKTCFLSPYFTEKIYGLNS